MPQVKRVFSWRFLWMLAAIGVLFTPLSVDIALTAWHNALPADANGAVQWLLQDTFWQQSLALDVAVVAVGLNAVFATLFYFSSFSGVIAVNEETDFYVI